MSLILRISAPYLAVLVFWVWLENGWLAIFAYHTQILFWESRSESLRFFAPIKFSWKFLIPSFFTGLIAYFFLPFFVEMPLKDWFSNHGISKALLAGLIPYFGILYPVFEQRHWQRINSETTYGHSFFGFYHGIVLYSLMSPFYATIVVIGLTGVSVLWSYMAKKEKALIAPTLFHIFADLGMIIAVYFLM